MIGKKVRLWLGLPRLGSKFEGYLTQLILTQDLENPKLKELMKYNGDDSLIFDLDQVPERDHARINQIHETIKKLNKPIVPEENLKKRAESLSRLQALIEMQQAVSELTFSYYKPKQLITLNQWLEEIQTNVGKKRSSLSIIYETMINTIKEMPNMITKVDDLTSLFPDTKDPNELLKAGCWGLFKLAKMTEPELDYHAIQTAYNSYNSDIEVLTLHEITSVIPENNDKALMLIHHYLETEELIDILDSRLARLINLEFTNKKHESGSIILAYYGDQLSVEQYNSLFDKLQEAFNWMSAQEIKSIYDSSGFLPANVNKLAVLMLQKNEALPLSKDELSKTFNLVLLEGSTSETIKLIETYELNPTDYIPILLKKGLVGIQKAISLTNHYDFNWPELEVKSALTSLLEEYMNNCLNDFFKSKRIIEHVEEGVNLARELIPLSDKERKIYKVLKRQSQLRELNYDEEKILKHLRSKKWTYLYNLIFSVRPIKPTIDDTELIVYNKDHSRIVSNIILGLAEQLSKQSGVFPDMFHRTKTIADEVKIMMYQNKAQQVYKSLLRDGLWSQALRFHKLSKVNYNPANIQETYKKLLTNSSEEQDKALLFYQITQIKPSNKKLRKKLEKIIKA